MISSIVLALGLATSPVDNAQNIDNTPSIQQEVGKKNGVRIGKKNGVRIGKKNGVRIGKKNGVRIGKKNGVRI